MSTPTLFTPLKLGSTTIPNRVGMSALTRNRASKTVPNDIMREYYVQRAQGGAGLIVTEGVLITRQGSTRLWAQSHIDGWKQIVDAVHATGSKIYAQLWHLGRVSHPD
ncbi:NADH:flavin oxidoreductase/NADH oxidase, partial [Mycena amicta]